MAKPKVFLGSSTSAYPLVSWLAQRLRRQEVATPVEWKYDAFEAGASTLESLLSNCWNCDLAVIFLTEDDTREKGTVGGRGGHKGYTPRDNCIFEAGLFVGALGLEPGRCLLVSSVELRELPTDLAGITVVSMPKHMGLSDLTYDWCEENLQAVFARVKYHVERYSLFLLRPVLKILTKEQLFEREAVGTEKKTGHLRSGESVVVNSIEPLELDDWSAAMQVMRNVKERIEYHYFFREDERGAYRWIELLRTLVLGGITITIEKSDGDQQLPDSEDNKIQTFLDDNKDRAIKVIGQMKEFVRIHLAGRNERFALKIIVHNAQSEVLAECYLRYAGIGRIDNQLDGKVDRFVHWCSGSEAKAIVEEILHLDEQGSETIFQRVYSPTRGAIKKAITKLFPPSLREAIDKACMQALETEKHLILQNTFKDVIKQRLSSEKSGIIQEISQRIINISKKPTGEEIFKKLDEETISKQVEDMAEQLIQQCSTVGVPDGQYPNLDVWMILQPPSG